MILKESKINSLFRNYLNNEVKYDIENINVGLEMELQTNSEKQDTIFSIEKVYEDFNIFEDIEADSEYFTKVEDEDLIDRFRSEVEDRNSNEIEFSLLKIRQLYIQIEPGNYQNIYLNFSIYTKSDMPLKELKQVQDYLKDFYDIFMEKKDDPEKQKKLFLNYSSELVNFIKHYYFSHLYDRTIFRDYYDKYNGFSLDDYSVQNMEKFILNVKEQTDNYLNEQDIVYLMYEEREYNDDEQVNIYYVSEDFINNHLYNLNLLSIQETFQLIYNYDKIFSSENLYEYFDNTPELSKIIRKYSIEVKEFYQTNTSSDTFLIEPDSSLRPNPGFKNTIELKTPYGFTLKEQILFFKYFIKNEEKMNGLKPNKSCGLHVNVSLKGQSNNIRFLNPVIFYELFNENKYKLGTRFSGDKSISGNEIENYEIKYQKQIKQEIKDKFIDIMKESNIDEKLQDKEYLRKFIRSINYYLNDQIKIQQDEDPDKYRSQYKKDNRIEFRIMGNKYLTKTALKYIIEMQGIYHQQIKQPTDIYIECKKRFIKRIIKELKQEQEQNDIEKIFKI